MMKKMMKKGLIKRSLTVLLTLALLVSAFGGLPVAYAQAADETTPDVTETVRGGVLQIITRQTI